MLDNRAAALMLTWTPRQFQKKGQGEVGQREQEEAKAFRPILEMRTLRLREGVSFVQSHTAAVWQSRHLNAGLFGSQAVFFLQIHIASKQVINEQNNKTAPHDWGGTVRPGEVASVYS